MDKNDKEFINKMSGFALEKITDNNCSKKEPFLLIALACKMLNVTTTNLDFLIGRRIEEDEYEYKFEKVM